MIRKFHYGFAPIFVVALLCFSANAESASKNRMDVFDEKNISNSLSSSYHTGISSSNLKSLSKYMVKLINKDRKKNGLSSVKLDTLNLPPLSRQKTWLIKV